jgi:hypothetical protein
MRTAKGLIAGGLLLGLVVGACGSSSGQNPIGPGGGSNPVASDRGSSLTAGLSSNLDSLTSYQFTESVAGSATGGQATAGTTIAPTAAPSAPAELVIRGTVVNKPTKSLWVSVAGAQYILVGSQAWTSFDNITWTAIDPSAVSLIDFLPGKNYATWFDNYAADFTPKGDESKNGVACIHYTGDRSLLSLYLATGSVAANLQADVWVARDGNYPVSGVYGLPGLFGYSFDITNVNDASNSVTPPTDVIALPT